MTVSVSTALSGPYAGDGSNRDFPVNFPYTSASEIEVYIKASDGTITEVSRSRISYPSGGVIIASGSAPALGEQVLIKRVTALNQTIDFTSQGAFFPETHEEGYDKMIKIMQEIRRCLTRGTARFSDAEFRSEEDSVLPIPQENAVLTWDDEGNLTNSFLTTGPQGPRGEAGIPGIPGQDGADGARGPKGDTGDTGPKGDKGDIGEKGDTGDQGPRGEPGIPGADGKDGKDGADGARGPKGDTGPAGPAGPAGPKGDTGDTGPAGPAGPAGPKGDTGDTGDTGPKGDKGATGPRGLDATGATNTLKLDDRGNTAGNIIPNTFTTMGSVDIPADGRDWQFDLYALVNQSNNPTGASISEVGGVEFRLDFNGGGEVNLDQGSILTACSAASDDSPSESLSTAPDRSGVNSSFYDYFIPSGSSYNSTNAECRINGTFRVGAPGGTEVTTLSILARRAKTASTGADGTTMQLSNLFVTMSQI